MIKPFGDKTLFDIACQKLAIITAVSPYYDCWVSVNEPELKQIATNYPPVCIWDRTEESATCDTGVDLMYEWWSSMIEYGYTHVVMFNACLPFLTVPTIRKFCEQFEESEHDGAFAVIPRKDYFWNTKGEMLNEWPEGQDLLNTKAVEETWCAAHALYGSRLDWIGQGKFVGSYREINDPLLLPVDEVECLDIDYPWQFDMCEKLYNGGFPYA